MKVTKATIELQVPEDDPRDLTAIIRFEPAIIDLSDPEVRDSSIVRAAFCALNALSKRSSETVIELHDGYSKGGY